MNEEYIIEIFDHLKQIIINNSFNTSLQQLRTATKDSRKKIPTAFVEIRKQNNEMTILYLDELDNLKNLEQTGKMPSSVAKLYIKRIQHALFEEIVNRLQSKVINYSLSLTTIL